MKNQLRAMVLGLTAVLAQGGFPSVTHAQGTAFTYQGRLADGASPANGVYDLRFAIYDSVSGGSLLAGPLTNSSAAITNGLFTATLDFGAVFPGASRWLEIGVRTNGSGSFATVAPRQPLTPSPYAITAENVTSGGLEAGVYGNAVTFNNPANSFSGNGGGLTNVNAVTVGGVPGPDLWQLGGNSGDPNTILGTRDNGQPLSVFAGNQRLLRLETIQRPFGTGSASFAGDLTGGSDANLIWNGVLGGTIAGGGSADYGPFGVTITPHPNIISDDFGAIGGGVNNLVGNTNTDVTDVPAATVAGGANNQATSSYAVVGGGYLNWASGHYSAIAGGKNNISGGDYSTIGGGQSNGASAAIATVGGGWQNVSSGSFATVAGGEQNTAGNIGSTIAGGFTNFNTGYMSAIGGGQQNVCANNYATVGGGLGNLLTGIGATIGGGESNTNSGAGATVAGGIENLANNNQAVVAGGFGNTARGQNSSVGGGAHNVAGVNAASVGGGSENTSLGDHSAVGGGQGNSSQGAYDTIPGGAGNLIQTNTFGCTISGGNNNLIQSNAISSVISGGTNNSIQAASGNSVIGGGWNNAIGLVSSYATIGGGFDNTNNTLGGTIAGGVGNTISPNGADAFVGGGFNNLASGEEAVVPGGTYNQALGYNSMIPGGFNNIAIGQFSFAAGRYAEAAHDGSFVWADSQPAVFASTATNQFNIRAHGGVRLNDDTSLSFGTTTRQMLNLWGAQYGIGVQSFTTYFRCDTGDPANGFSWFKGGVHNDGQHNPGGGVELMRLTQVGLIVNGTFVSASDRNAKEHFAPVDSQEVLEKVAALPVSEWNYKTDPASRHLGPMAQDFYAAFGIGPDDRHIATVDEGGVALAAIQGLNQKVETGRLKTDSLEQKLAQKETEITELKQTVAQLKELVQALDQKLNRSKGD